MSSRPAQIVYIKEGKAPGAAIHKGWAATWNWVLSWVNHLIGGKGCKIENRNSGHPRVDVLIEGGDGIDVTCDGSGKPYVISYVGAESGDDEGEPFDPDEPWDPSDPWNPEEPWNPDDPDAPYDGGDEEEDGGGSGSEEEDGGSGTNCNGWSGELGGAGGGDPGLDNDGDNCDILNGW